MSENFLFDPLFLKVYMYTYGVVLLLIMSSFAEACLVLSPVGAVVAAVIAIRRGLGAMKYALVGLLYSMAFAIPFGYLVSRMTGGGIQPRRSGSSMCYFICCGCVGQWQAGIFCYGVLILLHLSFFTKYRMMASAQKVLGISG